MATSCTNNSFLDNSFSLYIAEKIDTKLDNRVPSALVVFFHALFGTHSK